MAGAWLLHGWGFFLVNLIQLVALQWPQPPTGGRGSNVKEQFL